MCRIVLLFTALLTLLLCSSCAAPGNEEQSFGHFAATVFTKKEFLGALAKCDQYDIQLQVNEAVECFEKEARENPDSPESQYLLGVAQIYAGNLTETKNQFNILKKLSINFTKLLLDVIAHVQPAWMGQLSVNIENILIAHISYSNKEYGVFL